MVKNANNDGRMVNDPSPEEIRSRTAAIRSGWTERERARRASWTPPAWYPPLLELPELNNMVVSDEAPF